MVKSSIENCLLLWKLLIYHSHISWRQVNCDFSIINPTYFRPSFCILDSETIHFRITKPWIDSCRIFSFLSTKRISRVLALIFNPVLL